jgi:hypothetical protein
MTRAARPFWALLLALASVAAFCARRAEAQTAVVTEAPKARRDVWQLAGGVRSMFVRSSGLDPFSEDDHLAQFSAALSRELGTPVPRGPGLAVGLGFDAGSTSSVARAAETSLSVTRLLAFIEGRYHLSPRFYGFGRLAPGLAHTSARLREPSAPAGAALVAERSTFALDASVGAAFCVSDVDHKVGVWLLADAGYGWAPARPMRLTADLSERDQERVAPLDLGPFAPRGVLLRFALALSY